MVLPIRLPCSTTPLTLYLSPRSLSVRSISPSETAFLTRVELTSSPSTCTLSIMHSSYPSSSLRLSRRTLSPFPLSPKDTSEPAAIYFAPSSFTKIRLTKSSGCVAAVTSFKGNSTRISIPSFSKALLFSSLVKS